MNIVQSGQEKDMITDYRAVLRQCVKGMAQEQDQSEAINHRNPSGGGRRLSDALIAEINQGMITKNNVTLASNRRQMNFGSKRYDEDRNFSYTQIGEGEQPFSCFQIWRGANNSAEGQLFRIKTFEHQGFPCDETVGIMETKQQTREAEEQHKSAAEDQS